MRMFILVAVTVAAAGCSSTQPAASGLTDAAHNGPSAPIAEVPVGDVVRLLFDSDTSEAQRFHLSDVEEVAVATCMRAVGLNYPPYLSRRRLYFPPTNDGYGLVRQESLPKDSRQPPVEPLLRSMGARQQAAFDIALSGRQTDFVYIDTPGGSRAGVSTKGCRSQARQHLYGDVLEWLYVDIWLNELRPYAASIVEADAQYAAAVKSWRDCMADAVPVDVPPNSVHAWLLEQHGTSDLRRLAEVEVATARQDVACRRSSRLGDLEEQAQVRAARLVMAEDSDNAKRAVALYDRVRDVTSHR
jgi:hypothetical protein